ncbi:MAG: low molecular weight phosphotyrosine protein phosphatase [Burkholderiales bacterium]|nr:low molecular weight phosphotyrosine protein phosphatase [Burkholderiales bacterium]
MANPSRRIRILFVCLGNICRSPTAEVVFRAAAARAGLAHQVEIDSAGTSEWHVGNPPDYRATAHAARRGYDLRPLRARQVSAEDFARFDWIFAMDRSVLAELAALRPNGVAGHLGLFLDQAPDLGVSEVPDPYDGGPDGFEHVLDLIERGAEAFAAHLVARP